MAKVKTLKEEVYKKIAAGEVVERPLSVVKELVENAIDAGADSITVEIEQGGKQSIKVSDNGSGFDPEDIEPAFKNHSTSKFSELSDFDSLGTLGFRGEALPSILEVSKIEIETSNNNDGFGLRCVFEDGHLLEKQDIACNRGTTITVKELFYNFPVRRKFLKADRTEMNQIVSFLEPVTLVNYAISFELIHNGRTVFLYNKAETLKERIYQVFGKDFLDDLLPMNFEWGDYALTGFISRINTGVSVKKHQYYFVNRRPVREKTLIAAFNNTFQRFLEKSRSPVGILLFAIPPGEVDVNIHPMKLEIKFEDSNSIYRFIKHAVESAFSVGNDLRYRPSSSPHAEIQGDMETSQAVPGVGFGSPFPARGENSHGTPNRESFGNIGGRERYAGNFNDDRNPRDSGIPNFGVSSDLQESSPPPMTPADYEQAQLFAVDLLKEEDFRLIGQYKNSYIIVERNQELLIIDQHNAQERVNFDRLKKQYQEGSVTSISPLFPVIIELTPSEAAQMNEEKRQLLEKIGFRLEPLIGNSFDVKSFPQVLGEKSIRDALLEILHMEEDQVNFEDRVLADIACKSAIKVNHKLYPDQMTAIVKNLFQSTNPYFCPHKRPIIIEFTLEEIEKRLKRK